MTYKAYLIRWVIGCVVLTSCDDRLDLEPFNAATEDQALITQNDFSNAIRGAYSQMRQSTYYGGWMFSVPDVLSDNLIISSEGRTSKQDFHYFNYTGNVTWLGLWDDGYEVSVAVNLILENVDRLSESTEEDLRFKNNIRGEALALRALAHFDMVRAFSATPARASSSDLGIPYMLFSDPNQLPSRPPLTDTYRLIISDLEEARGLINEQNEVGRLSGAAVAGLLSRVYLYTEDYPNVVASATAALEANGQLNDVATFPDLWRDQTETGVLFKVRILDIDGAGIGVEYSQTGPTGVRSEYVVDHAFYQTFADNDIRKQEGVYFFTSPFAGKSFRHIAKYFGRGSGNANVVDAKVLRVAEVYLNRAEAYAVLGDEASARADLNTLRAHRYVDATPGQETGNALREAILAERRKELAFEGHRFFDLKRLGLPVVRSNFGDEVEGGGQPLPQEVQTLPITSHKFLLPIPQTELNVNSNLQQNPEY